MVLDGCMPFNPILPQSPRKSDANVFFDMILRLLEEHSDLTQGVPAAVYDQPNTHAGPAQQAA